MSMRMKFYGLMFLVMTTGCMWAQSSSEVSVARARQIAFSGKQHRPEAEAMLRQILEKDPENGDARTLLGTLLSWDGNYDESRKQLQTVIDKNPDHSDALPAMMNMELWSDHPERTEQLARDYLGRHPNDPAALMFVARAQRSQRKYKDSIKTLDQLLSAKPGDQEALEMKRRVTAQSWGFEAEYNYNYDWLSDKRETQKESLLQLRSPTPLGSVIGRLSRADRFGVHSYQLEMDAYPHFRPGTYAYVNVGFSPDQNLYPDYRVGFDLNQSVGHGFEVSGGYRRLQFSSGTNIATFAVYKYWGNWMFWGRGYFTPDELGTSRTGVWAARRFFGSEGLHDYAELRVSRGASLALARTTQDILSLNSTRVTLEYDKTYRHWAVSAKGGAGKEDVVGGGAFNRYTAQFSTYYRF
jgi:YaiO family outer membrane protein